MYRYNNLRLFYEYNYLLIEEQFWEKLSKEKKMVYNSVCQVGLNLKVKKNIWVAAAYIVKWEIVLHIFIF
jgi:hypothetical protein